MLKRILYIGFCFVILCSLFEEKLMAREPDKVSKSKSFNRLYNNGREETACNISNLSYWTTKTGGNLEPGVVYPRLTTEVVTSDGLVWGGYVHDTIDTQAVSLRVGGQVYLPTATVPGWIEQAGDGIHPAVRIDPANPRARLYRILRGWKNLTPEMPDVIRDAAILNHIDPSEVSPVQAQEVIDQYEQDWSEWPVDLGAPLIDVNGNGSWDQEEGLANADQIIWLVVNDLDSILTHFLLGSPPIGLEVQITIWAYDQPDASLGQTVFKRFRIINKSGFQIDSMYVAQWSDPDVGFWADDLVGCDIPRNLGFAYTGYATDEEFDNFNLPPPAVGYDFLQGPILYTGNPVDSALFDFKYRSGYINLPMTSFGHYSDGSGINDSWGDYDGTLQWYNMLKGFIPTTDLPNPSSYIVGAGPDRGQPTKFPLSGDPFLQTGDIDAFGDNFAPGDRRINLCSGPFNMAPGDTQEVVVALIGGIIPETGGNNRNAIAQLKLNDDYAQFLFDHLFVSIPKPPAPAPAVQFTELTDKIMLNWGSEPNIYSQTEKDDPILGFNFEGYNIYQLPSANATKSQATLVKTFDKVNFITTIRAERFLPEFGDIVTVPIQHGTDSGIQRYFLIDKDYINNRPLYAGSKYYFAVTAYNYNPDPNVPEPSLESALNAIEVIPQPPKPGTNFTHAVGEELTVTPNTSATQNTGDMTAYVVDPAKTRDATYEVRFRILSADSQWYKWDLVRILGENETVLLSDEENLEGGNDYPIVDGIQVKPVGPKAPGLAGWDAPAGERWVSGTDWEGQEFFGGLDLGANFLGSDLGSNVHPVHMEWQDQASVDAEGYWSKGAVYRRDNGYAFEGIGQMPFRAFDVLDPANPRRINVCFVEDDREGAPGAHANLIWDMGWNGTEFGEAGAREYLFFNASDYDEGAIYAGGIDGTRTDVYYAIWPASRSRPYLLAKFTFEIYAHIPNRPEDVYSITTTAPVAGNKDIAKANVDKIKVFPNPYYAYHSQEANRSERFVTFTHLPDKATIRIFNLAGTQVRKLLKIPGDGTGQFLKWDLNNDSGLPVASGFYIAYIDMPDLNKTKAVKFFILQRKIF